MIRFDKETKRRFGIFSLINVAVLLVAYGALFICFGIYVSDSGDRAAEKLAREYAEELQGYSYAELVRIALRKVRIICTRSIPCAATASTNCPRRAIF